MRACLNCGGSLEGRKATADFCGGSCRAQWSREEIFRALELDPQEWQERCRAFRMGLKALRRKWTVPRTRRRTRALGEAA